MKKYILIAGLLALAGTIIGYKVYNKPHQNISTTKAEFKVEATGLFEAYTADENMANTKYLDKVIEVSGKVSEVKKNEDGSTTVVLESDDMMFGVSCQLDQLAEHKRTSFKLGEQVTLKGKCTGILMDVVMVRCVET